MQKNLFTQEHPKKWQAEHFNPTLCLTFALSSLSGEEEYTVFVIPLGTGKTHLGSANSNTECGLQVHYSNENAKCHFGLPFSVECSDGFIEDCNYPFPS